MRAEYWYIFGLFAIIILAWRWWAMLQVAQEKDQPPLDPQDRPLIFTFSFSVFVAATGTLAKLPPVASTVDWLIGPHAAWLIADIFFISATCSATIWLDLILQPSLKTRGWRLLFQRRVGLLLVVALWMITAARLEAPTWTELERGAINVEGNFILGSARLAYLSYNTWTLAYIALRLYYHRRLVLDRDLYIRMTMAFVAFGVAVTAPVVQILGLIYGFVWSDYLEAIWPQFWIVFTAAQTITYGLIMLTFLPAGYRTVIWLDKQLLLHRLRRVHSELGQVQPQLISHQDERKRLIWQPDPELAVLVSDIRMIKQLVGEIEGSLDAPAGAMMSAESRQAVLRERAGLRQILNRQPGSVLDVYGETYALAWWYATVGG